MMITEFQIFEKKWTPKTPKWFFLVLRVSDNKVWDSLMRMEFIQLKGISDNYRIAKSWFDIRELFLIMKGSEVFKMNDVEPIEYFNPDSFCKNNFKLWRRVISSEPQFHGGKDITFRSGIEKILSRLHYTHIRIKKNGGMNFRISYDNNRVIKYIEQRHYDILGVFSLLYHSNQLHINTLDDFTKLMLEILKDLIKSHSISTDWPWEHWEIPEEYIMNKLKFGELKKILSKAFDYISKVYEDEGEWSVIGKSFKIPKGSILYFKEEGGRKIKDYSSRGMERERIDNIIKEYGLDHIYDIKTVHNHIDMMEILKNEYSNE